MRAFRANDWVCKAYGIGLLVALLPLVAAQIVVATVWEWVDINVVGLQRLCARFNEGVRWHALTIHREDEFMVNVLVVNGVLLPLYFCAEALAVAAHGFSWQRMLLYNCLRFGPNVSNFAWVNTLIHKCCHTRVFKARWMDSLFEFWVGNFYGVVPGNYSLSHVHNHHKHDNSIEDVITVIDFARDSFVQFCGYHWRYFQYTINLSTALYFFNEGETLRALKTCACSLYYALFTAAAYRLAGGGAGGAAFALFYVLYPMLQGNLIISAINYAWHAFVHPGDEQNRLVNSTTIVNGQYFIMDEEYHAVHHMYAGIHNTKYKAMYDKHRNDCKQPTVFYDLNVFELWGMITFRDYAKMAANAKMDESLIKQRLRHTVSYDSSLSGLKKDR